jgi:oxalate decarboxylase/phosphoglucose isomerase-like protein (cupin superfamily)
MLSGTCIQAGFLLENGIRLVENNVFPGQGMIFPKNSFHYQANLGCDPVTFVAGWNQEDPGASTVGQRCK